MTRCEVSGGSPQQRVAVRSAVEHAMQGLDYDALIRVVIGAPKGVPPGVEASANDGEIWVDKSVASKGGTRLGWIVTEEVAHLYLAEHADVPHGGTFIEVLIQELFGAWAQYREHILGGLISVEQLTTTPVMRIPPTPASDLPEKLGYQLGKHIAAAALGSAPNAAHLADWMADPDVDDKLKQIIAALRRELPWQGSPTELAGELGKFYTALSDAQPDRPPLPVSTDLP